MTGSFEKSGKHTKWSANAVWAAVCVNVVAVRRIVKDHLASICQLYIIIPHIAPLITPDVFTGDNLAVCGGPFVRDREGAT